MQIGTKNERYFIVQVDLFEKDGCEEAVTLIRHLLQCEYLGQGLAHLQTCLEFAQMIDEAKRQRN